MGAFELVIVLAIILLFAGTTRLPKLAKSLGESVNIFKKSVGDEDADKEASEDNVNDEKNA